MRISSTCTSLIRLKPHLRNYAWGSPTMLPNMVGMPITGEPIAELWYGAHPTGSSVAQLSDGSEIELNALIASEPRVIAGSACLPFMIKLLAIDSALSLQVHPNESLAAAGYAQEEGAGISLTAPNRMYKDPRSKPELFIAVTPCRVLAGFRPPDVVLDIVRGFRSQSLYGIFADLATGADIRQVMGQILALPRRTVGKLIMDALEASNYMVEANADCQQGVVSAADDELMKSLHLLQILSKDHPGDVGILAALLCNDIVLKPTEAIYVPPGLLHCYVRGVAVEVMGNSDNVVRGGLTTKHIDKETLIKILSPAESPPSILLQTGTGGARYCTGTKEFQAIAFGVTERRRPIAADGPAIALVIDGQVELLAPDCHLALPTGHAVFIPAGISAEVSGRGRLIHVST
jgi:mannose-6-phosphate isomerase